LPSATASSPLAVGVRLHQHLTRRHAPTGPRGRTAWIVDKGVDQWSGTRGAAGYMFVECSHHILGRFGHDSDLRRSSPPGTPTSWLTSAKSRRCVGTWFFIQTPEWGGGEIWFDGALVRKDGRFLLSALQALNPENLV
jgi:hypothetical protein